MTLPLPPAGWRSGNSTEQALRSKSVSLEAYLRFRAEFVALDPERYPAAYIDQQVMSGRWRCWGNDRAAILAELKQYPSGAREVRGLAAAKADKAALDDIIALIPLAEQWGREAGCKWASIESHPAWARLLPGYAPSQLRIVKDLA